ncbi:hypothetical protein CGCF413_v002353 [Colletotrichum fructicola]|nr:hypothetical protein CGCF413_v002353 [Colletotrichum fructicola]
MKPVEPGETWQGCCLEEMNQGWGSRWSRNTAKTRKRLRMAKKTAPGDGDASGLICGLVESQPPKREARFPNAWVRCPSSRFSSAPEASAASNFPLLSSWHMIPQILEQHSGDHWGAWE